MAGCFILLLSSKTTNTASEHEIEKLMLKGKYRVPDWVKTWNIYFERIIWIKSLTEDEKVS